MRESVPERKTVKKAKAQGYEVRKVKWIGVNGAPDRLFGHEDYCPIPTLIEFKRTGTGNVARIQQMLEHDRLRRIGFRVFVCDNEADALKAIGFPGA